MSLFDNNLSERESPLIHLLQGIKDIINHVIPSQLCHYNATCSEMQYEICNEAQKSGYMEERWETWRTTKYPIYKLRDVDVHLCGWLRGIPVYDIRCMYYIDEDGTIDNICFFAGINGVIKDPSANPRFELYNEDIFKKYELI